MSDIYLFDPLLIHNKHQTNRSLDPNILALHAPFMILCVAKILLKHSNYQENPLIVTTPLVCYIM